MLPEEIKEAVDHIIAAAVQRSFVEISEQVNTLIEIALQGREADLVEGGGRGREAENVLLDDSNAHGVGLEEDNGDESSADEGEESEEEDQDDEALSAEEAEQSDDEADGGDDHDDGEEPRNIRAVNVGAAVAVVENYHRYALYNVRRSSINIDSYSPSGIKITLMMLGFRGILMTDIHPDVRRRPGCLRDGSCWVANFQAKGETARILENWCNHPNYPANMHLRNVQVLGYNRRLHIHILPATGRVAFGKCAYFRELANSVAPLGQGVIWGPESVQLTIQGRFLRITLESSYTDEFAHHAVNAFSKLTTRAQRPIRRHALRHGFRGFGNDSTA